MNARKFVILLEAANKCIRKVIYNIQHVHKRYLMAENISEK